jgi:hypothetical protein
MTDEPRMVGRVRVHRPDLWREETTSRLRPDERDLYLGLSTMTDDGGTLLWRPTTIAAALYPYTGPAQRLRDLDRRAAALVAAGLLAIHKCGCGTLPRGKRDVLQAGGNHTFTVTEFHGREHSASPKSGRVRTDPDKSPLGVVLGVGVDSDSELGVADKPTSSKTNGEDPTTFGRAWDRRFPTSPPTEKQWEALHDVLDARPSDSISWLQEVPAGAKPYDAVAHILDRWRAMREGVPKDKPPRGKHRPAEEVDAAFDRDPPPRGHTIGAPAPPPEPDPAVAAGRRQQALESIRARDGAVPDALALTYGVTQAEIDAIRAIRTEDPKA